MEEKISMLHKCSTTVQAFELMEGSYWLGDVDSAGCFSVLTDNTFPGYIRMNAIEIILGCMKEGLSKNELASYLSTDINGVVRDSLLGQPFILYSLKLGAYYCFHFDSNLTNVSDRVYVRNYIDLIKGFDFPTIVSESLGVVAKYADEIRENRQEAIIRIYENELGDRFLRRSS